MKDFCIFFLYFRFFILSFWIYTLFFGEYIHEYIHEYIQEKPFIFSLFCFFGVGGFQPFQPLTNAVKSRDYPWFAPFYRQVLEWCPRIGFGNMDIYFLKKTLWLKFLHI